MRSLTRTLSGLAAVLILAFSPTSAFAQEAPAVEPGICAPWHRCLAMGTLGLALIAIAVLGLGFMIQRKGFNKIEHRQGSPDGVETEAH